MPRPKNTQVTLTEEETARERLDHVIRLLSSHEQRTIRAAVADLIRISANRRAAQTETSMELAEETVHCLNDCWGHRLREEETVYIAEVLAEVASKTV